VKLRRVIRYLRLDKLLLARGLRKEIIFGQPSLSIPIDISLIKRG
jgi:hypothetical protein